MISVMIIECGSGYKNNKCVFQEKENYINEEK